MKFVLKKIIKKLYHLIYFLTLMIIFIPNVKAVGGVVNIDGTAFETASFASFADVTNGQMTRYGAVWVNDGSYFRSQSNCCTTTGGSTNGAGLVFDANQTFVAGYTYVVSVIIGMADTYPVASDRKVCIAETIPNASTRWNQFSCPSAEVTYTTNKASYTDGTMTYQYGLLNYVFTSNVTGTSIAMDYQTAISHSGNHTFGGYRVTALSDNSSLSQADIRSAVQSSGLATASSVQQVQQSITQVQQQLGGVQDSIDDVNDTLNDSSIDSSDDTLSDLQDNLPTNSVISDILLLPVRLLQAIINSLGGTCSNFNLGSLYGTNLVMPCIDIQSYVGNSIWTFIDLVFSGLFVLTIRKKFIQIWENITNLKGGANEVD